MSNSHAERLRKITAAAGFARSNTTPSHAEKIRRISAAGGPAKNNQSILGSMHRLDALAGHQICPPPTTEPPYTGPINFDDINAFFVNPDFPYPIYTVLDVYDGVMVLKYTFDGTTYYYTVPVVEYSDRTWGWANCVYPKNGGNIQGTVYVNTGSQYTDTIYNDCPDSNLNPQGGSDPGITINTYGAVFLSLD